VRSRRLSSITRARKVMDFPFPIPDVKDLRTEAKSFDGVAGLFPPGRATIGGEGTDPEQIRVEAATPNLLPLLGARMFLGRHFIEEDGKPQPRNPPGPPGAPPAAQQATAPREQHAPRSGNESAPQGKGAGASQESRHGQGHEKGRGEDKDRGPERK